MHVGADPPEVTSGCLRIGLEWKMTCHHNDHLMEHGENFAALHKQQYLYLMAVWGHSYEFDQDNNRRSWSVFELMGHREDIWYTDEYCESSII